MDPQLFSLYTSPLSTLFGKRKGVNFHFYADDTQLDVHLSHMNASAAFDKLNRCLQDVKEWMSARKFKLNPDKTEFNPDKTKFILIEQLCPYYPISILSNQVSPAKSVKNLGVVFDSYFTFSDHVSQVIKSTTVHARDLCRICRLLDFNTSVLLANALMSSRLIYCNSLFVSLTGDCSGFKTHSTGFVTRSPNFHKLPLN